MSKKPATMPNQAKPNQAMPDRSSSDAVATGLGKEAPEARASELPDPEAAKSTTGSSTKKSAPWYRVVVIVAFAIVYVWYLFSAVVNFVGKLEEVAKINEVRESNSFVLVDPPWLPLIASLALPIIVFGLALLVARKRSAGLLSVILLAGLGVVAAVGFVLITYVRATTPPF